MGFSKHRNLETPDDGTANWGASVNENMSIIEHGSTLKASAGAGLSVNHVMYIDTSGDWQYAIADGTVASRFIGISTTEILTGVDGYGRIAGYHNHAHWEFDPGMPVYLSAVTPGGLTTIAPSQSVMVGFAVTTNEIMIRPWIEHGEMFGLDDDDHTLYLRTDSIRSTAGLTCDGTFSSMVNLGLGTIDQFGAGTGIMGMANASAIPTENPIAGGVMWTDNGGLFYRGSAGTTTLIAVA